LPEFARPVLESLRQPLEDGVVVVARVLGRAVFPARFQLVATMNLCPCGARGDPAARCACSPQRVQRYRERLSRALLDRFDLSLTVPRARGRVLEARVRLRDAPPELTPAAGDLLTRAVERLPLSGRGRARVARVACTVAALAGSASVEPEHLAEALSYRPPKELVE
jgi:magnesium chelatase family protein